MRIFKFHEKLTPNDVFYAAAGVLLNAGYQHMGTIINEGGLPVCVQFKKDKKTFVLYYPGKDNEIPEHGVFPLSSILADAFKDPTFKQWDISHACHLMVACESNDYNYWWTVRHYVFAKYDGGLTITDSIDRDYDDRLIRHMIKEKFEPKLVAVNHDDDDDDILFEGTKLKTIEPKELDDSDFEMIPTGKEPKTIKRGWQNQVTDYWQCGFYVLNELASEVTGDKEILKPGISDKIIKKYQDCYDKAHNILGIKDTDEQKDEVVLEELDDEEFQAPSNSPK